jgi:hypothetical protein
MSCGTDVQNWRCKLMSGMRDERDEVKSGKGLCERPGMAHLRQERVTDLELNTTLPRLLHQDHFTYPTKRTKDR